MATRNTRPSSSAPSSRSAERGTADRVGVGAEPERAGGGIEDHVADGAAAALGRTAVEERLRRRIEADEAVRRIAGLEEPEPVAVVLRHRVGAGLRAARQRPLLDLT